MARLTHSFILFLHSFIHSLTGSPFLAIVVATDVRLLGAGASVLGRVRGRQQTSPNLGKETKNK